MRKIQPEELKELQMQMLDYIDSFCRQHGISYTISGGTLLGAVRHGGYIPWDDDVDIQLVRDEYNRFTKVWNQSKHPYELINIESGNSMGYPFGKIHDPRTVTFIGKLERTGVFVDVFPVDKVIDDNDFVCRHELIKQLYKKRIAAFEKMRYKNEKPPFRVWLKMLFKPSVKSSYNAIAEEINRLALKHSDASDFQYYYEMISGLRCKQPIDKSIFAHYSDIRFEDRTYMSVSDYDTYLTRTFGNYMELPPVDQRVPHPNVAYWRD